MKKGISLVALIVTIIVLIILTGAVILSFQDGGIIDRADQAVEDSNDAVLEEKITMMNMQYVQKMKKQFTPKTRETLKAIVKQSGIDLDKLLVYYDAFDGQQYVCYKLDKVSKADVKWFLENEVEIEGETEPIKVWQLFGDFNLDGEIDNIDNNIMNLFLGSQNPPEIPYYDDEGYEYAMVVGDIDADDMIDTDEMIVLDEIKNYGYKYAMSEDVFGYDIKAEQLKTYFGIE